MSNVLLKSLVEYLLTQAAEGSTPIEGGKTSRKKRDPWRNPSVEAAIKNKKRALRQFHASLTTENIITCNGLYYF